MEHESTNTGSFAELPQPQEVSAGNQQEAAPAEQPERRGGRMPSTSSQTQTQTQQSSAINDPQQMQSGAPTASTTASPDAGSSTLMADDTDLIEKEWVVKAKAIVAQTKDDPHQQNREMNKVKADYLKKRYNKDLKLNEG